MEELRRRLRLRATEERGSMLPYVVAGVFVITLIGYMLIGYLGDGYDESWGEWCFSDRGGFSSSFDSIGWSHVKGEVFR